MKQNLIAYTVALLTLCTTPFGHAHADANANAAWVYDYDENAALLGYYIDAEVLPASISSQPSETVGWHLYEIRFDTATKTLYKKDLHPDVQAQHPLTSAFAIKVSPGVLPNNLAAADIKKTTPHQYYPTALNDFLYLMHYQIDNHPVLKCLKKDDFNDGFCSRLGNAAVSLAALFKSDDVEVGVALLNKKFTIDGSEVEVTGTDLAAAAAAKAAPAATPDIIKPEMPPKFAQIIRFTFKDAFGIDLPAAADVFDPAVRDAALIDYLKNRMIQNYQEAEGIFRSLIDSSDPHAAAALYDIGTVGSKFADVKKMIPATVDAKYKPLLDKVADPVAFDAVAVNGFLTHNKVRTAQLARFFNKAARKATDAESKMMQAAGAAFDTVTAAWTVPFASAAKVVTQVPFKTAYDYCAANGKRLIRHCEELCYFLAYDASADFRGNYSKDDLIRGAGFLHSSADACLDQCDENVSSNSNVFTQGFTCFADKK